MTCPAFQETTVRVAVVIAFATILGCSGTTEQEAWELYAPEFRLLADRLEELQAVIPGTADETPQPVVLDPLPTYREQGWEIPNTDVVMYEQLVNFESAARPFDLEMSGFLLSALPYHVADAPPEARGMNRAAVEEYMLRLREILDIRYLVVARTEYFEPTVLDRNDSGRVVGASGEIELHCFLADLERGSVVLSFPLRVGPDRSFHYLKSDSDDGDVAMLRGATVSRLVNAKFAVADRLSQLTGGSFKVGS